MSGSNSGGNGGTTADRSSGADDHSSAAAAAATTAASGPPPLRGDTRLNAGGRWVVYTGRSWRYKCEQAGCTKAPTQGFAEAGFARFCVDHRQRGCINFRKKKACAHPGCRKHPSFAAAGEKPTYCQTHCRPGDINVQAKRCAADGCRKQARALVGGARTWCSVHKPEGSVHAVASNRICRAPGCETTASFGLHWQRPLACARHALPTEDNCVKRRCLAPLDSGGGECVRQPTHGPAGGRRVRCARHRLPHHVSFFKRCEHDGCTKAPSFGTAATGKRFCASHKGPGDTFLGTRRRCAADGCSKSASFAPAGQKATWCLAHSAEGDINVVTKRCVHPGCGKIRSYGPATGGSGSRSLRCSSHATPTDVLLVKHMSGYGLVAPRFRGGIGAKCADPDCHQAAAYGPPPAVGTPAQRFRCSAHATAADVLNLRRSGYGKPAPRFRSKAKGRKRSSSSSTAPTAKRPRRKGPAAATTSSSSDACAGAADRIRARLRAAGARQASDEFGSPLVSLYLIAGTAMLVGPVEPAEEASVASRSPP